MKLILTKRNMPVGNTLMEGTVSQIFHLGLCFHFMLKNGKIWVIFSNFISTFHKTKIRTYIKNLRHGSLYLNVI